MKKKVIKFLHSFFSLGFPFMMLVAEWGLKTILKVDALGFVGPALAAAGLSYLPPLLRPKKMTFKIEDNRSAVVQSDLDYIITLIVMMLIPLGLFAWAATCYFSITLKNNIFWEYPLHFYFGFALYIIGAGLTLLKELFV